MTRFALLLLPLLALSAGARPAPPSCTAIVGAEVEQDDGPARLDVVIADGRIAAVGASLGLAPPADGAITWNGRRCAHVDGRGQRLAPGFIEPGGPIGLVEVGMEAATRHADAGGPEPVRAHIHVIDGYDPLSSVIPVARREGITGAVLMPGGGSFSGTAGAVVLAGTTQAQATMQDAQGRPIGLGVAVRANLSQGSSFPGRLAHLRTVLEAARAFGKAPSKELPLDAPPRESLVALQAVLDRSMPLVLSADRAADLEALTRFVAEEKIRLVVEGAAEGWIVAPQLAEAGIAVLIDPFVVGAGSFDQLHGRADNGALLRAAGVSVMIGTGSGHFARKIRQMAGNAVRGGMSHADALAAITSVPARVYGLGQRGKVAVGYAADLVLWTGDPLEIGSWPSQLWIGGVAQGLASRQTELLDRYRTLPGSPLSPLPLPESE